MVTVYKNFVIVAAGSNDYYSRGFEMGGGNTVELSAEATFVNQDVLLFVEFGNDLQNWSGATGIGTLNAATYFSADSVGAVAARYFRVKIRMAGAGTLVVSVDAETSAQ